MSKRKVSNLDLYTLPMSEVVRLLKPWQLGALLELEPYRQFTDILLSNMMDYFLANELYEYCVIIRDEIESRK
ncbi:hypothetical protein [Flavobacterium chungangensis]|uniref:Uncharacterized protein n=1 Tax=Flavobacterium chungangensis TaxID=2708132 RepID=A0ABV8ZEK1_9FLAO